MKIEELRVGNWIYDHTDRCELQMSLEEFQMANNYTKSEHPLPFKPIPLTEEWLIKFGGINHSQKDKFYILDISLAIPTADNKFRVIMGNFVCELVIAELEFVHELQNFYYSIRKKELTIK